MPSPESFLALAELSLYLVAMERAGAAPLSFGPPAEGAPPVPMEQSQAKRPRPPAEAEQVRATRVAPHLLRRRATQLRAGTHSAGAPLTSGHKFARYTQMGAAFGMSMGA